MHRSKRILSIVLALLLVGISFSKSTSARPAQMTLQTLDTVDISERLHLPTTAETNMQRSKRFLETKTGGEFSALAPGNTELNLVITVIGQTSEGDLSITSDGTMSLGNKVWRLSSLQGYLSALTTRAGGQVYHGVIFGELLDGTSLTITTTYNPATSQAWLVTGIGSLNSESALLAFGTPMPEALTEVPEALQRGYEERYGPVKHDGDPGRTSPSDNVTTQSSCGVGVHFNYGYPPDPNNQGDDYRGRKWQQIVDDCGWTLGAVMLWAPDGVGRGDALNYGARVWSDTYGATKAFQEKYGLEVKNTASVYAAALALTANPDFSNAGYTVPRVGQTGSNLQIPLAELASAAGCTLCWWIPNPQIPMNVTSTQLRDINGGTQNQLYVQWQTSFSFSAADTDYVSSAEPYKDRKGFAVMSPFSRQTSLTSTTYLNHYVSGAIYYRIPHITMGVATLPALGEAFSWSQRNTP